MKPAMVAICAAVLWVPAAPAATYVVRPDGTGDFPTIQAAIDAAADMDVIELATGTFRGPGNRDLNYLHKAVTVRSQSGDPGQCRLDAEGSGSEPHRGFYLAGIRPPGAALAGITITGCWTDASEGGSAVYGDSSSTLAIADCVFDGNHGSAIYGGALCTLSLNGCLLRGNSGLRGGGILCMSASLETDGCEFAGNSATWGGAICCSYSSLRLTNCSFTENTAEVSAAVDCVDHSQLHATDCWFGRNETTDYNGIVSIFLACVGDLERCAFFANLGQGSSLYSEKMSRTRLANCTFWGNQTAFGVVVAGDLEVIFQNTIIAFNPSGPAVVSYTDTANLSCCDLYGNAGGDWVGSIADQLGERGNIALDPLFCDAETGDLTLHAGSPCAPFTPPNPECDLIGARPVACGPTLTQETTWGRLKARFR